MRSYHVGVSAEAFAAALFAHAGCDVLIQYGANQPEYDLVVVREQARAKVSVKGSQDGGWVLAARHKKAGRSYHDAADAWASSHADSSTLYCFVQFKGIEFGSLPRVYLAPIPEVCSYLKASCAGHGYTSVREQWSWARGKAHGTQDVIPQSWSMTLDRIGELVR